MFITHQNTNNKSICAYNCRQGIYGTNYFTLLRSKIRLQTISFREQNKIVLEKYGTLKLHYITYLQLFDSLLRKRISKPTFKRNTNFTVVDKSNFKVQKILEILAKCFQQQTVEHDDFESNFIRFMQLQLKA